MRYATTTHEMSLKPPSELAIVGSALARMVWSAAARNIATMTPGNTRRKASRIVIADGVARHGLAQRVVGSHWRAFARLLPGDGSRAALAGWRRSRAVLHFAARARQERA